MDDLVVDGELTALVVDDEDTDRAAAVVEGFAKTGKEAALVKDWEALLDITSLGHGNNLAVITDVENTVLLEDRTDHVLDNHRWGWVADEGALLVQLLGEEVNTKVAVLASLRGCGDADDLARTTLEDEKVTNADVVAWNGDSVWSTGIATGVATLPGGTWSRHGNFAVLDDYVFLDTLDWALGVVVAVVVAVAFEWVEQSVSGAADSVAERVVVSVFVVISHIKTGSTAFGAFLDVYFGVEVDWSTLSWILALVGALVLPTTRSTVLLGEWCGTVTKLSLGDVDVGIEIDLSSWSVTSGVLVVVDAVLDVDLSVGVALVWLAIAAAVNVNLYASINVSLMPSDSGVLTVTLSIAVFFCDANFFAVAVVATGSALLVVLSIFPSSALNSDSLVSPDLSLRSLFVPVG